MQQTVNIEGTLVKLHIWDTGGSDRFRSLVSMYYRDAIAAIICYDLTNEKTFESVNYWTNEMADKNNMEKYVLALAGNKCDVPDEDWKINEEMLDGYKQKFGHEEERFVEAKTSAKTGDGVHPMFQQIAEKIVKLKNY